MEPLTKCQVQSLREMVDIVQSQATVWTCPCCNMEEKYHEDNCPLVIADEVVTELENWVDIDLE